MIDTLLENTFLWQLILKHKGIIKNFIKVNLHAKKKKKKREINWKNHTNMKIVFKLLEFTI